MTVEVSPYDLEKGRLIFRHKDERAGSLSRPPQRHQFRRRRRVAVKSALVDAMKAMPDLTRRRFISGGASLGALTLLTGCDVLDGDSAEDFLQKVS